MSVLKFEMDSRWEGYVKPYTQEKFKEIAESYFNHSDQVPTQIKDKLERVKSVYILRSVDYELQDVAEFLIYTVFKLALRLKYESVKDTTTKKSLGSLLYWAKKNSYLSLSEDNIKFICESRNNFAHLNSPESLHGTTASFLIDKINDWINELYSS